jgi:predicted GNAT family acetyltransferase
MNSPAANKSAEAAPQVQHEAQDKGSGRFVIREQDQEAVLEYRSLPSGEIELYRTFVPEAFRGRGLAAVLVESALAFAGDKGLGVIPACSYVKRYLEEHPPGLDFSNLKPGT